MPEIRLTEIDKIAESTKASLDSTAKFLQELRQTESDSKRTAGMIVMGGALRGLLDTRVLLENSNVCAVENTNPLAGKPSQLLPETREYLEKVTREVQARNAVDAAKTSVDKNLRRYSSLSTMPARIVSESVQAIEILQSFKDRHSWLAAETSHRNYARSLLIANPKDVKEMVVQMTGTMEEARAGAKLYAPGTLRHAQVSAYAEAKSACSSALEHWNESTRLLNQATSETTLARQTAQTSFNRHYAPSNGFARGAGGMIFAASALTGAELLIRQARGESINAETFSPSPLLKVNEVDALGIGFLASRTMSGKARVLGYVGTLAAGRTWNALTKGNEKP